MEPEHIPWKRRNIYKPQMIGFHVTFRGVSDLSLVVIPLFGIADLLGGLKELWNDYILSRWFKVTFWSPSWRSLSHWKGHLTILKRSQRMARVIYFLQIDWNTYLLRGLPGYPPPYPQEMDSSHLNNSKLGSNCVSGSVTDSWHGIYSCIVQRRSGEKQVSSFFQVTFWSPKWRSLFHPCKGHE